MAKTNLLPLLAIGGGALLFFSKGKKLPPAQEGVVKVTSLRQLETFSNLAEQKGGAFFAIVSDANNSITEFDFEIFKTVAADFPQIPFGQAPLSVMEGFIPEIALLSVGAETQNGGRVMDLYMAVNASTNTIGMVCALHGEGFYQQAVADLAANKSQMEAEGMTVLGENSFSNTQTILNQSATVIVTYVDGTNGAMFEAALRQAANMAVTKVSHAMHGGPRSKKKAIEFKDLVYAGGNAL